jgi:trk system potassium uptake protein TrkA
VLELELDEGSRLVGEPIKDLVNDIDGTFVIGAITRGQSLISPRGDTVLNPGDHVIILVEMEFASELASLA